MSLALGLGLGPSYGGGVAFSPLSLYAGGVQGAYFDPSDLSTMSKLSTDVVPNVAVGDPVGLMLDKSGNGNHWLQATSSARPTLQQDGSGKYYLSLDGVDDLLLSATGAISLTRNMVLVTGMQYASGGASTNYNGVFAVQTTGVANFAQIAVRTSISSGSVATRGFTSGIALLNSPLTASNGVLPDVPYVLGMKFGTSTQTLSVNGVDLTPTSHTWGGGDVFAADVNTGTAAFAVTRRIYSAVAIDRDLTDAEHASLLTWINQRTGAF